MLERADNFLPRKNIGAIKLGALVSSLGLVAGCGDVPYQHTRPAIVIGMDAAIPGDHLTSLPATKARDACLANPMHETSREFYIYTLDDMIRFHNNKRMEAGLPILERVPELDRSARETSEYLAEHQIFDHVNAPGEAGLLHAKELVDKPWLKIGENLGISTYENDCYGNAIGSSWMASPGHMANILDASYTQIGIGAAVSTTGQEYITVHFANVPIHQVTQQVPVRTQG